MQAQDQSITDSGSRHSKRQVIREDLLKRHSTYSKGIVTHIDVQYAPLCQEPASPNGVFGSIACVRGENLQSSVQNFGLPLYCAP